MATYQLRDCDDTILAQAELASDTKTMAWLDAATPSGTIRPGGPNSQDLHLQPAR